MAIQLYRGNNRQVANPGPSGFNLSHKQQVAVAKVAGNAGRMALRAMFGRQNAGGDSRDAVTARRGQRAGGGPRRTRGGRGVMLSAPGAGKGQGWDHADYLAMSGQDARNKAWLTTPASSNLMAPRGHGYYDAFANHAAQAMTNMSIGPATPIAAKARVPNKSMPQGIDTGKDIGANSGNAQLLIIGPAAGSTQGTVFCRSAAPGTQGTQLINSKPIDASALPLQVYPTTPEEYLPPGDLREVIPIRCSVRIRNFTAEINRGGIVHVLRMTTGINLIPQNVTNDDFDEILDNIRDHARTRTYDGAEFCGTGLQKNCVVADQSRSLWFQNFNQATISSDVPWALDKAPQTPGGTPVEYPVFPVEKYLYDPTYTPIAILFEPFVNVQPGTGGPVGNSYGITIQTQFLAHYKQGTMLANLAISPMSDANKLNAHRDKEERSGSAMQKVADVVVGAGKFAWEHRAELAALAPMVM